MNLKEIYLTTTLPYVNSAPHIGHALEFIQADAIVRYLRGKGHDVFFNLGTDEHGLKVWETAKRNEVDVKEYVDGLAGTWKDFCQKFKIDYTNFYRTSDPTHGDLAAAKFHFLVQKGDIYKKFYSGSYCSGCESFKTEKDLHEGKCPDHPTTEIQKIEEENYFFRLSKYKDHLINWINQNPDFLQPENKLNELKNLIEEAEDISISRLKKNLPWGVPVPFDNDHVIYVWFEALLNYIFSCQADSPIGADRWKNSIQICGPDNLKFQGVIWQGILAALELPQTKKLLVHGTVKDNNGLKMSKSLGNVVDPIDQINKYGLPAVRYYALVGINTFENSGWSEDELVKLYDSHLADDYGNLIARTLHLIDKYQTDIDPDHIIKDPFASKIVTSLNEVNKLLDEYRLKEAGIAINAIVKEGNRYIATEEPWKEENKKRRETVLNNLFFLLTNVTFLYEPFIPIKAKEVHQALKEKKKAIIFPKTNYKL